MNDKVTSVAGPGLDGQLIQKEFSARQAHHANASASAESEVKYSAPEGQPEETTWRLRDSAQRDLNARARALQERPVNVLIRTHELMSDLGAAMNTVQHTDKVKVSESNQTLLAIQELAAGEIARLIGTRPETTIDQHRQPALGR